MDDHQTLIETIAGQIAEVEGVSAVVLGGSRARSTHTPSSDIDLGIYYDPAVPLNLEQLRTVAAHLDDEHRTDVLTEIGGWGPWINGGGWLHVQGIPVDFIYRDLRQVEGIINACRDGRVEVFYQPGHPHGFFTSIYMGEVDICRPLCDNAGRLAALKAQTRPYPPALKQAMIARFWEVDFAVKTGAKAAPRGDVHYAAGCCFRAVACLLQTLFALNEQYCLNEKGALQIAEGFATKPRHLKARVDAIYARLDAEPEKIKEAIDLLASLENDTAELIRPS